MSEGPLPHGWTPFKPLTSTHLEVHAESQSIEKFHTALEIVGAYTEQRLTYASDAFAAILGALNTLAGDKIHHILGLPYKS